MARGAALLLAGLLVAAAGAAAQSPDSVAVPAPPSGLEVRDVPRDAGDALDLRWKASPVDVAGGAVVSGYRIERAPTPAGAWVAVDSVAAGITARRDLTPRANTDYFYRVVAIGPGGAAPAVSITGPVQAIPHWFHPGRLPVLVFVGMIFILLFTFIARAESGWRPAVDPSPPGPPAIDPGVRLVLEAGRPDPFTAGVHDVDDLQTLAHVEVLRSGPGGVWTSPFETDSSPAVGGFGFGSAMQERRDPVPDGAGGDESGAPRRLGTRHAADAFKLVLVVVVVIGCALESAGIPIVSRLLGGGAR